MRLTGIVAVVALLAAPVLAWEPDVAAGFGDNGIEGRVGIVLPFGPHAKAAVAHLSEEPAAVDRRVVSEGVSESEGAAAVPPESWFKKTTRQGWWNTYPKTMTAGSIIGGLGAGYLTYAGITRSGPFAKHESKASEEAKAAATAPTDVSGEGLNVTANADNGGTVKLVIVYKSQNQG